MTTSSDPSPAGHQRGRPPAYEEVAERVRAKRCSKPLQSSGRGGRSRRPLPRLGRGRSQIQVKKRGHVKDTITMTNGVSRQGHSGHDAALQGLDDNGRLYAVARTRSAYDHQLDLCGVGWYGHYWTRSRAAHYVWPECGRTRSQSRSLHPSAQFNDGAEEWFRKRGKEDYSAVARKGFAIWRGNAKEPLHSSPFCGAMKF